MDSSIFFGGSIIAAVVAGMLALFAPCCISFMLPAYFASSFQNRLRLVAMTFVFAAGVATIILPIALGASFLRQVFAAQHMVIYVVAGVLLLGLAVYLLLGGQLHWPMPGGRAGGKAGIATTYTMGLFSGITSSCCAPVLAGVIALSSVAPSFWVAWGLGSAYVFGMVAPLLLISMLWEHFEWKSSRLFQPRTLVFHLGSFKHQLLVTNLVSGLLLLLLGIAMIWVGFTTPAMSALRGWQATFFVWLQHSGNVLTIALLWIPNWVIAALILSLLLFLAWHALRPTLALDQRERDGAEHERRANDDQQGHCCGGHREVATTIKEPIHEHKE
jgi:cytochrome c-type biogenesis protein